MRSLAALVLLSLALPSAGVGQHPLDGVARQGGAWELTIPPSEMPDQPSIILVLEALNVIPGPVLTFRPALYLRCLNQRLEALVTTGAPRHREHDYRSTVRLRWAERPPQEETWFRSTDFASVFAPDATRFIQQLLATPGLAFEFPQQDGVAVTAEFNGGGLDSYLPRLQSRCGDRASTGAVVVPPTGDSSARIYINTEVDQQAVLRSMPGPEYPHLLYRAGVHGVVIVQVVVDALGHVEPGSPHVVSSPHPEFNEPAVSAALNAQFAPARVRGQAVRVRLPIRVEF